MVVRLRAGDGGLRSADVQHRNDHDEHHDHHGEEEPELGQDQARLVSFVPTYLHNASAGPRPRRRFLISMPSTAAAPATGSRMGQTTSGMLALSAHWAVPTIAGPDIWLATTSVLLNGLVGM